MPWAVVFKDPQSLAPLGVPLHPTQLYHALGGFLIFFILLLIKRKKLRPYGQLFSIYLILHGISRIIIEFFRGDPRPELFSSFTVTQGIALILAIGAFAFYLHGLRKV